MGKQWRYPGCPWVPPLFSLSLSEEECSDQMGSEGGKPGDQALPEDDAESPVGAEFPFDGGNRCDAGCV